LHASDAAGRGRAARDGSCTEPVPGGSGSGVVRRSDGRTVNSQRPGAIPGAVAFGDAVTAGPAPRGSVSASRREDETMQRLGTLPALAIVRPAAGSGADAPTGPPAAPTHGLRLARDTLTLVDSGDPRRFHTSLAGAMVTVSAPDHQYVFEAVRRY